ncbi:MAG: hypothetical protein OXI46_08060 [Gemmatimonadota bacterium]|nr:hypothetical protein [Gemmatimonadota bacterium]
MEVVTEQQRVAVGRVLASRPVQVLTDEPTVNLEANAVFASRDDRAVGCSWRPVRMVDGVVPSHERRP